MQCVLIFLTVIYRGNVCAYARAWVKLLLTIELNGQKGPMDILVQTLRKEGFFALYKGTSYTIWINILNRPST